MKKLRNFAKSNMVTILGAIALIVGTGAASACTFWNGNQPECPKELLK